ncbi:Camelysin metallo-endopeptidase [Arthrobacter sp. ov407]|uniref:TasA family protein n=1 Tax=Arthrobacter sp. ov407 TaxID=1761748 RepID=UPI000887C410|nr:TasA family protein [Arthrobacter sp. ov407]SDL76881.1 Camelysin metallo-endopeptidase [Arthrobacter sp. ov407]
MGLNLKSTSSKVLASAALLAAAAGVAGMGTYGGFTASTSASAAVSSGTVHFEIGTSGAANRLSVAASGAVPGDSVQRAVTLTNSGDQNLAAVTLTTTAAPSSKLDSDATNGLQMQVDSCSIPWAEAGTSPSFTYTCSGTTTTVLASRAVVGNKVPLSGLASVTASKSDNLRVSLTVPATADNTFQGLTSTINFVFDAAQRTGGAK